MTTQHLALVRFPWFNRAIREALGADQIGEHHIKPRADSHGPVDVSLVLDAGSEREARFRIARALPSGLMPWPGEVLDPPDDGRGYIRICARTA